MEQPDVSVSESREMQHERLSLTYLIARASSAEMPCRPQGKLLPIFRCWGRFTIFHWKDASYHCVLW